MRSLTFSLSSPCSSSPSSDHRRRRITSKPHDLHLNLLRHGQRRPSTTISISEPANFSPFLGVPCHQFSDNGFHANFARSVHVDDDRDDELTRTTVVEEEEKKDVSGGLWDTLGLAALFGSWTIFNIYFNIYNKQVLKVYQFPVTVTVVQFAIGTILVLFMWATNLYKKPKISSSQLVAILPLAIVHTLGNLFTNMSLGKVAVSFTHTIKASEPFFSVLLSAMFLGETPTLLVVSSLVPIVGGVALASMTEASFNWVGFWSAMASNLTNQSRNVLSKKFMVKKEESLDNITLFSVITIMSFFLLAPFTLVVEGLKVTPSYLQSAGLNLQEIYVRSLLAGLCYHAYQQVSYMILARVSPVTHSVGNCVKRVVVIVTSILFFRTPVSLINSLGTGVALLGVFLYSRVKKIKSKKA